MRKLIATSELDDMLRNARHTLCTPREPVDAMGEEALRLTAVSAYASPTLRLSSHA